MQSWGFWEPLSYHVRVKGLLKTEINMEEIRAKKYNEVQIPENQLSPAFSQLNWGFGYRSQ